MTDNHDSKPHDHDDHSHKKVSKGPLLILAVIAVIIAVVGIGIRMSQESSLEKTTEDNAIISVTVMKVPQGPQTEEIVLPGNVQAWHEAPIFARTSGYLKNWHTDIGSHVKAGDLLAEIDTPEVDAQYNQAMADLGTAEANNKLAQSTAERWAALLKTNSVSKQEADEKSSAAAASAATVASAQANVDRLKQLEGFKMVTAPIDGVITARNTDVGALINAGSSGTGFELFHIAETDRLRVYIQVPQTYVGAINPDIGAELHFAEHPGEVFQAKFNRSADALDATTRTLLVELEVDNGKGVLIANGYAEVHLKLTAAAGNVRLPVNTLLFRSEGMQVATVDGDNKVVLKPIKISRDFGNVVEVLSGINAGEEIVVNPPDSLTSGQQVKIAQPTKKSDAGKDGDKKSSDDKDAKKDKDGKDK